MNDLAAIARSLVRRAFVLAVAALAVTACGAPSSSASATFASASSQTATAPACTTAQLRISLVNGGGAAGTVGGYLKFVNASNELCFLQGWPTITGETAAGTTTAARQARSLLMFPDVTGAPAVTLDPGAAAGAALAGGDNPGPGMSTCPPPYRTLRVTPPGNTQPVSLSAWIPYADSYLPACSGIEVTMVVPAADLPLVEPTPTRT